MNMASSSSSSYTVAAFLSQTPKPLQIPSQAKPIPTLHHVSKRWRPATTTRLHVSSPANKPTSVATPPPPPKTDGEESIFFDGGAHYGDLMANLLPRFTLLWLPLTLAAVSHAFFLKYRFTNLISDLTGQDRSDLPYKSIKDVQVVPRFFGEWGDIVIMLKDGTKVDLRSLPKFREITDYCLFMADQGQELLAMAEIRKGF